MNRMSFLPFLLGVLLLGCNDQPKTDKRNSQTQKNMKASLFESVTANDTAAVLQLVRENRFLVHERNPNGYTALMLAAGTGNEKLIAILLENGADVHATDPVEGASALHMAALGGNIGIASLLVKAGAQINLQAPSHGMTPLMNAVWHNHPEMVRWLLDQERINVDIKNALNLSAEDMIAMGEASNMDDKRESASNTQLMRQYFEALKKKRNATDPSRELISVVAGYDQNLTDQQIAEKIKTLVSKGADVNAREYNNYKGNDYHTPLLIASRDGKTATVKQLLESGADITLTCEYMKANPAHKAAYFGHAEVLNLLANHKDFDKIKNAQGPYNGYTPLHDAVWHNHVEAVKALLKAGVTEDVKGLDGLTPLEMAKNYQYQELVKLLGP